MFLRQVKLLDGDFSGPDQYLAAIPAVQKGLACGLDLSKAPVTFFVWVYGMGKSTLLEAIGRRVLGAAFFLQGYPFRAIPAHSPGAGAL